MQSNKQELNLQLNYDKTLTDRPWQHPEQAIQCGGTITSTQSWPLRVGFWDGGSSSWSDWGDVGGHLFALLVCAIRL